MEAATLLAWTKGIPPEDQQEEPECLIGIDLLIEKIGIASGQPEYLAKVYLEEVFGD